MAYEFKDLTDAERTQLDQLDAEIASLQVTLVETSTARTTAANAINTQYQEDLAASNEKYQVILNALADAISARENDRSHIAKPKE